MSGKQTLFKTMNKGSWRMLQDRTIYATVHRLNKAKNNKTKDDSQTSICEGRSQLAGAYTQGQKKAQRCFILFVPCTFHIQLISERLLPILFEVPFSKEREKDLSSHRKHEPSCGTLSGEAQCSPSPPTPLRGDPLPLSEHPCGCSCSSLPWHRLHFSWYGRTVN